MTLWQQCLGMLEAELPEEQYETYIKPLQADFDADRVTILAPNIYVEEQVKQAYLERIQQYFAEATELGEALAVGVKVGAKDLQPLRADALTADATPPKPSHNLNSEFTFATFVEGKSNELAKAAAQQVAENSGQSYNPLLLYGGVGLGKTHLMQAVGNGILQRNPNARVVYIHSQRFVQDMVKALQQGTMQDFMQHYRSVDALLIDDIQFFAKKLRSGRVFPCV